MQCEGDTHGRIEPHDQSHGLTCIPTQMLSRVSRVFYICVDVHHGFKRYDVLGRGDDSVRERVA